ncbi:hypothetical protein FRC01_004128 [Tulasnella sp. 417]|nr:hypothetical protein FRC01_004128 [Tulasnella sp. 417]
MLSLRLRGALRARPSTLASTATPFVRHNSSNPPKPIKDSTSALDYKSVSQRRTRPPPLPSSYVPQSRTAEEAVTNILYNTPPPNTQPYKKHILNCLVQNEPGVLSRVSGCLAARGFNIDSLVVCRTEIRDLSRMCIVLGGQDSVVEQVRRQLEDLVPVWAVLDYTNTPTIARELLLAKVSILGPEYVEQLSGTASEEQSGAPSDSDSALLQKEASLAQTFENGGTTSLPAPPSASEPDALSKAKSLSEVLRNRHIYFAAIRAITDQFGGKIVDIAESNVIVELSGKSSRVEAFLGLMRPFGVLEAARTGLMVMPRTPVTSAPEDQLATSASEVVDASLLPPG